ncbi:NAD(P)-binding oxidoreductase [Actinokineospora cianjurensis]|uniref:Putative NAD(P)-binding protein n=1 Tax=Actinokineospora cianjurensis TaxID=585224 RepID=A0A421B7I6_9PSEU|nr:NAD(P)-binding oxidoreductase [Actinokineospora cianjurensis]RLK60170.1 putative NAD(P)-binding protein [Actinokineospora cianjurensis]
MRLVIAGGHGKIALVLTRLAADRGDTVIGVVRNPDHVDDIRAHGGDGVVLDLETATVEQVAAVLAGADAVVFAAGAGPGSGIPRKDSVDRGAAALTAEAAQIAQVRRYVQISAMGLDRGSADDVFSAYLAAKDAAERDLRARDLDWTIVRPGRLSDDAPTGRVSLGAATAPGVVSRADVAAVLVAVLDEPRSAGLTLELVGGDVPVVESVAAVVS